LTELEKQSVVNKDNKNTKYDELNLADHTVNRTNPCHGSVMANMDVNGKSKINIVLWGNAATTHERMVTKIRSSTTRNTKLNKKLNKITTKKNSTPKHRTQQ
jgi:hypothetical protein